MIRKEKREIEVSYCEICNAEAPCLEKCAFCKRGLCLKDGGKEHFAYSLELFRYADSDRRHVHICHDCCKQESVSTIGEFLDAIRHIRT